MMTEPGSLAEICLTVAEFARCLSRHTVTARKWFEADPKTIRIPRGGQRDQILIPISHAVARCREMRVPEDIIARMVKAHEQQIARPGTNTIPTPPVTKVKGKREIAGNAKLANLKSRSKSRGR